MTNKKKLGTLIISIALVAAIGVGSTLAYLTSQTGTVTNTFTVGSYSDTALDIFEHQVAKNIDTGDYEQTASAAEVKGIAYDAVLPATTLDKDPTLRLAQESPSSFLVMKATGIDALTAQGISVKTTNIGTYWKPITVANATAGDTYYIYCPKGDNVPGYITATELKTAAFTTQPLFTELSVAATYTQSTIDLVFKGCAVQYGSDMTDFATTVAAALPAGFIA